MSKYTRLTVERAQLIVPPLVEAAEAGRRPTYKELGDKIGIHHRPVKYVLEYIRDAVCRPAELPLLTSIVVRADSKRPGDSWRPPGMNADIRTEQARVFAYADWRKPLRDLGFDV